MYVFLIIGSFVGFFSGLLGIGGGILLVPTLKYYFEIQQHISPNISMHIAVANSLAVIIFTSSRTAWFYYQKGNIELSLFKHFLPGLLIGSISGTILSNFLSGPLYSSLFALLLFYNATKLIFFTKKNSLENTLENFHIHKSIRFYLMSTFVGATSAILGVGGAVMMTPFFINLGLNIRKAIGTSILCSIPVAIMSTLSVSLIHTESLIKWPIILIISLTSMLFSPVGAKLAHQLNQNHLKKFFALFLIIIAIKMLF